MNQIAIQKLLEIRKRIDSVCYYTSIYDHRRKELDGINSEITAVIADLQSD